LLEEVEKDNEEKPTKPKEPENKTADFLVQEIFKKKFKNFSSK
jgi:hypothetical protein